MENAKTTYQYKPIRSVSDAEQRLIDWKPNQDATADFPAFIINELIGDMDNDGGPVIIGTSDQFHNLSSEFARKELYKYAKQVAEIGLSRYRYNADLLADLVRFGANSQDWEDCKKAFAILRSLDFKSWTWRCFTFCIDYLMDYMEVEGPDEIAALSKEVEKLIKEYKKMKDERAWVSEAKLRLKQGRRRDAIKALKNGVETVAISPQCCLKLADLLLEDGEYAGVVKYSAIGIRATAQDQPSASSAYLLYVSALAKDALIHQEEHKLREGILGDGAANSCKLGFHNRAAVEDALLDYDIAKRLFGMSRRVYTNNIKQREIILKAKSGISSSDEDVSVEELQKTQQFLEHFLNERSATGPDEN